MNEIITETYKVGGLTLVTLGLLAFFLLMMLRFVFKRMDKQDSRISQVESEKSKLTEGLIKDNITALHAVVHSGDRMTTSAERQTAVLAQLVAVMNERPCFDQAPQPKVSTPKKDRERTYKSPLPQTYEDKP